MKLKEEGQAYSLFLSHFYDAYEETRGKNLRPLFPRGIPIAGSDDFILETATETAWKRLADIPQPFVAYFHFLPPHAPYRTSREFYNAFKDDVYKPLDKPPDLFARFNNNTLPAKRREYDEFILYCDKEFSNSMTIWNHPASWIIPG